MAALRLLLDEHPPPLGSKGRLLERNCRRSRMFSSCNKSDEEAVEKSRDSCLCMCQIEKLVILVFLVLHSPQCFLPIYSINDISYNFSTKVPVEEISHLRILRYFDNILDNQAY